MNRALPASPVFDSGEMLDFRHPGDPCGALEKACRPKGGTLFLDDIVKNLT